MPLPGGVDQEQFEITDEGGLRFKAAPNYEVPADVESADPANVANNNEYIVEVTATGGASERVLTAAQTIVVTVTDKDDEAPSQPAVPTIAEATLNSLKVTWAVPANTGPEITDYDVQYKASGDDGFTGAEYDGTDLTLTLTNLKSGTSYEVQVRATNDEGSGAWSDSGEGMTIENQAPIFTSSATFEVKENNTTVGAVSANDEDSDDSITGYAITGGVDQEQFEITDEGGLRFKAAPNYEVPADVESTDPANVANNNEYIVEVTATGGASERVLTAAQMITVTVSDKDDEAPGQPAAPTIAEATMNSLKVTWEVPANAGPEITDYDVQYKASGESEYTDAEYDGIDLTMTLTNLKPGTSYEVQVRATSDEGTGAWSDSGEGMTIENQAPTFTSAATFEVKENNTTVGTVSANDEDSDDSITGYAITGGVDQEQFEITDEGGLRFKAAPNYEVPADVESADPANVANNNEYIVEVTATGGASERVLTAKQTLTVTVTDKDDEAPGQPAAPTIAEATMNSLKVTWAVPANMGPEITDYDVQYKASGDDGFTGAEYDGTDLTMTLTDLKSGTSYEVQVRATNDEGTGNWSESGEGMTIENQAPVFTSSATFEVKENNTTVGTVSANDEDSDDSITGYAITGGVDQAQFEITDEGGLRFKAAPNYEVPADVESADPANAANNNEYIVEVTATGGASERVLTAKQTLTVTVSDKDDEAPGQPAAPTIAEATMNSLKVTWEVPANTGPEITDYDVQYKASDDDGFTDAEYDGTDLTLTLTDLKSGTSYEVQVRAKNDEGTGAWSDSGKGKMKVNVAPVFTSNATFNVLENVTGVGIVVANDADSDDSVTSYAITGGADQTQFFIVSETGVLIFKAAPDFEAPLDADTNNAYIVEVTAMSGENGRALTATQAITVIVTDIGSPELDAPTVTQATMTTLTIIWGISSVLNTDNVSMFHPIDVALDIAGNKMYWTDSGSIRRADLDGTNVENVIRNAVQAPIGIALDIAGNKMYWVDPYTDKVQRADLDGENVEDLITGLPGKLGGIALDIARNKMYWTDSGSIRRADLDGENIEDLITGLPDKFGGIALDIVGNKMYWAISDRIRRADLDGENVEDLVTTGLEDPFGIALDIAGNKMYWADRGTDKVQRADLDGENVEDLIATGLEDPFGIALDIARNKLYWTEQGGQSKKIGRIDIGISYDIQYRSSGRNDAFIDANASIRDKTITIMGLEEGTNYEIRVRATNAEGQGEWSELGEGATVLSVPTISSVTPGARSLRVALSDPLRSNITGYDVRYILTSDDETVSGNWTVVRDAGTSDNFEYTINGLVSGSGYDVQVRAKKTSVRSAWSATMVGTPLSDYDDDNDGLIEVSNLEQLNAIRYDLDGNGAVDDENNANSYDLAFPLAPSGMGCPSICTGYELTKDLDFNSYNSYASGSVNTDWTIKSSDGWEPIGTNRSHFTATFHGNGHTISNLFIQRDTRIGVGLFGYSEGTIKNVGLIRVNVNGNNWVGGLVGRTTGEVSASYVTGQVAATHLAGGLAGDNRGVIHTSYARVSVDNTRNGGGLVGQNGGTLLACYSTGLVNTSRNAGGLVGWNDNTGTVRICYTTVRVWDNGTDRVGGFFGGASDPRPGTTFSDNYWQVRSGLADEGVGYGTENEIWKKFASQMKAPTDGNPGIYSTWDDEDVDGDDQVDAPWTFGTSEEYPVLKVDFNGDGMATWSEFGSQRLAKTLAGDWAQSHGVSEDDISYTWTDFMEAKEDGRQPILPDFSYAGYHYFEKPVPDVTHRQFDVRDYGAIPNDNVSDQSAIQAAIEAAEANGSGIVFFPPGEFLVSTNTDKEDDGEGNMINKPIYIGGSNIVLRGSGRGSGGTVIRQVNHLPPSIPNTLFSSPYMFTFKPSNWPHEYFVRWNETSTELARITEDAARETFWITVSSTSALSVDQRIVLYMNSYHSH